MAVPKRRTSKAKRDSRRAQTFKLSGPALIECPQCKSKKPAHRVCPVCGYYKGVKMVATPDDKKRMKADA